MANELEKRFGSYQLMEQANDSSLATMISLRNAFVNRAVRKCMEEYVKLVKDVNTMGKNYANLGGDMAYLSFSSRFTAVEKEAGDGLQKACSEMMFGMKPTYGIEEKIDGLNYDENNLGVERFDECKTIHDFVRCLHCSSLESLFDGKDLQTRPEEKSFSGGSFRILKGTDSMKDLLNAIYAIYVKKVEKAGSENGKLILANNGLFMRLVMGCHMSYVDVRLNGGRGNLGVRFANTDPKNYAYAGDRGDYVAAVLKAMNFDGVTKSGNMIFGTLRDVERKDLPKNLEETMRFLASTKDLDICRKIRGNVDFAVKAFFEGKTNIHSHLNHYAKGGGD